MSVINVLECIGEITASMMEDVGKTVKEELGKVAVLLQIAIPVLLSINDFSMVEKIVLSCGWVFIVSFLKRMDNKLNNKFMDGFPLPPCKMIDTESKEFLQIVQGNEEEAVIYLDELERYLKRRGLLDYE